MPVRNKIFAPSFYYCVVNLGSLFHSIKYLSQNISAVKKGEDKKVQVIERPKGVISL